MRAGEKESYKYMTTPPLHMETRDKDGLTWSEKRDNIIVEYLGSTPKKKDK